MKTKFKWTIEIEVAECWVADGFNPDADQFQDAVLSSMLGYARTDEVKVKLLKRPNQGAVAKAQGYQSAKAMKADDAEVRK